MPLSAFPTQLSKFCTTNARYNETLLTLPATTCLSSLHTVATLWNVSHFFNGQTHTHTALDLNTAGCGCLCDVTCTLLVIFISVFTGAGALTSSQRLHPSGSSSASARDLHITYWTASKQRWPAPGDQTPNTVRCQKRWTSGPLHGDYQCEQYWKVKMRVFLRHLPTLWHLLLAPNETRLSAFCWRRNFPSSQPTRKLGHVCRRGLKLDPFWGSSRTLISPSDWPKTDLFKLSSFLAYNLTHSKISLCCLIGSIQFIPKNRKLDTAFCHISWQMT